MAALATAVSVEQYLHSTYRPDCDYVNGEVLERNMGEFTHGWVQRFFTNIFVRHPEWGLESVPETRLQVKEARFRIPDVMVVAKDKIELRVVRKPPVLCVEVFSSEDRMGRMQERVSEYVAMGVQAVWAVDPWRRVAYVAGEGGRLVVEEALLTVPGTEVRVGVEEVWAELDRLEALAAG